MVTPVDAAKLLADCGGRDFHRGCGETADEGDVRSRLDLLVEEIALAGRSTPPASSLSGNGPGPA